MIFAREISDPLTSLVKKLDEATAKNSEAKMASFVVFLGKEEGKDKKLKDWIEKEKIEKMVVTLLDDPAGPKAYKVSLEAEITVVLYKNKKVEANFAFPKGKMTDKDVDPIVNDLSKILPKQQ